MPLFENFIKEEKQKIQKDGIKPKLV